MSKQSAKPASPDTTSKQASKPASPDTTSKQASKPASPDTTSRQASKPASPKSYWEGKVHREGATLTLHWDAVDEDLRALSKHQGVTHLYLAKGHRGGPHITDAGLGALSGWVSLKVLELSGLDLSDAGLAHLRGLTGLHELWLDFSSRITDAGLVHLGRLIHLRVLRFHGAPLTDAGLAHLKGLRKLENLQLGKARISDAGLPIIGAMKRMKTLDLQGTLITDAGLAQLRGLVAMRWRASPNTKIGDAGLAPPAADEAISRTYIWRAPRSRMEGLRAAQGATSSSRPCTSRTLRSRSWGGSPAATHEVGAPEDSKDRVVTAKGALRLKGHKGLTSMVRATTATTNRAHSA